MAKINWFKSIGGRPTVITIFIAIIGWSFFSNTVQNTNMNNTDMVIDNPGKIEKSFIGSTMYASGDIIAGDKVENIIKPPTQIEEQLKKLESDARTNLEAFFRRWARGQYEEAFQQLDKQLANTSYFQTGNLKLFHDNYLGNGSFYLDGLELQGPCQPSIYVDRCEFNFSLRYVNKEWNKKIIEKRHAQMLINKDEFSYFKVGLLRCVDKNCENSPLFD